MATAEQRAAYEAKAEKAFRLHGAIPTEVLVIRSTLHATFRTEKAARKAAAAMLGVLRGIRTFDTLADLPKPDKYGRRTKTVWAMFGTIA